MVDIFLSYRRETGIECCSVLYEKLTSAGYHVFFDHSSLRQGDFQEQIEKAISECTFLLVVLSGKRDLERCFNDPENDWILHEVSLGLEYGKIIIPVSFKSGFEFPEEEGLEQIDYLKRQELCDISGPDMASLISTKLFDFMEDVPAAKLKHDYIKGITDPHYLSWEIKTLQGIYRECGLLHSFDKAYPVVTLKGSESIVYPFDGLNPAENLEPVGDPVPYEDTPYYHDFKKIIGPNVHYPNLYGFTNVGIDLDDDGAVIGFKAKPRMYKETVFTGHILHYELWKTYQDIGRERPAGLNDLPIRSMIHNDADPWDVLLSGCNRSSLADVSIAILAYDEIEGTYDIAVATRTHNVTCYPGYLSIVPSGGFELYELETKQNDWIIKKNFSMIAALYREYIEEIFGDEDFSKPTGNDDLKRLYRNEHIKALRKGIGKTYFFEFLGVEMDLISLRPTFSFVLRIDDPDFLYSNDIKKNEENVDIRFISLSVFEEIALNCSEHDPLMPESAGVYELLKNNHLFKEAKSGFQPS